MLGNEEWTKGNMVVYAPTINIDRDPRWGRNFESLSEDPFLTGALGSSVIRGIQSQGPIAQVKHYAVYNVETNRNTSADDDVIDARTLHEIYLPAFYDTTIKAGAGSVMCSYSSPNGTFACQNQPLLSILEQHWGTRAGSARTMARSTRQSRRSTPASTRSRAATCSDPRSSPRRWTARSR